MAVGVTGALGRASLLAVLAGTCGAAETAAPQAVSASYQVFRNGMRVGVANETFEVKDGQYRIVSESHAVGLLALFAPQPLRVTSSGRLTGAGLMPEYFESRRGEDDPRQIHAEFDWQGAQLKVARSGHNEILPLAPGTQDPLSIMYQFMFLAPDGQQVIDLTRTNGRRMEQHHYTVKTGVEIETPIGRMATVHLVKQHKSDEGGVELWLAPQHRYLPMKLLILQEDGVRYEQVITKIDIKP